MNLNLKQSEQSRPLPQSSQDSFSICNQKRQIIQSELMINNLEFEEQKGYLNTSFLKDDNPGFFLSKTETANQTYLKNSINQNTQNDIFIRNSEILQQQLGLSPLNTTQHKQRLVGRTQQRSEGFHLQIFQQQQQQQEQKSKVLNQYQKIMIHFYVKKFIKKLTQPKNKAKELSKQQISLIDCHLNPHDDQYQENSQFEDPFYNLNLEKKKQLYWKKLQKRIFYLFLSFCEKFGIFLICLHLKKILDYLPIISPESTFKNCWDLMVTGIRIYFIWLIPIQIAFHIDILYQNQFTLLAVLGLFFDILLNFNTSYYDVGQQVIQRKQIFQNYLKNYFLTDFSSTIVLTIFFHSSIANTEERNWWMFVLLIFFVQFKNLSQIFCKFEESFNNNKLLICSLNLIKVLMIVLFNEHIFSCLWYFVGDLERQQGKENWIDIFSGNRNTISEQYITSFYFTCVTMVSVGYGDITPISQSVTQILFLADLERIVCIIFMLFSCVQLSYSVNAVGAIVRELSSGEKEIFHKLRAMNQYMQKKKISYSLQFQIRQYLSYYFKQQNSSQTLLEQEIILDLSEPLREKLLTESYSIIIQDFFLFQKYFSMEFKKKLIGIVKEMTIFPDGIISQHMQQDYYLYFIENGKIQVSVEGSKKQIVSVLHQGKSFGVLSFMTEKSNQYKYKSLEFSKLLVSKKDFLSLLKEFPEDYEEYCMIKDKIQIYDELKQINYQCQACSGYHEIQRCPLIHFIPDYEKIIKHSQFNQKQVISPHYYSQDRQQFQRTKVNPQNQYNSRLDAEFFYDLAIALQNYNADYINNFPYGIGILGQVEVELEEVNQENLDIKINELSHSLQSKKSKSQLTSSVSSDSASSKSQDDFVQKKKKGSQSSRESKSQADINNNQKSVLNKSSFSSKEPDIEIAALTPLQSRLPSPLLRSTSQQRLVYNEPIQSVQKRGSVLLNRFNFQNQKKEKEKDGFNIIHNIKAGFDQQIIESRSPNPKSTQISNAQPNGIQLQRRSSQKLESFKAIQTQGFGIQQKKSFQQKQLTQFNNIPINQIMEEPIQRKSLIIQGSQQIGEYTQNEEFNKLQNLWLLRQKELNKVLTSKDLEQLQFYILQLKLQIEQEYLDFEVYHQYKKYFSQSNNDAIIAQVNDLNKMKVTMFASNKLILQQKIFTQFCPYLIFPNAYYKNYKTKQIQVSARKSIAGSRKSRIIKLKDNSIYPLKD